jgi:hypothetical protein
MDVLISFYIENELSEGLRSKVEEHLNNCETCRAKYNIISSLLCELKDYEDENSQSSEFSTHTYPSIHYNEFRNKLSEYMDNELPPSENIKIKKLTINNRQARRELEDSYNIRRLMKESFRKTNESAKEDFSKKVMKHLSFENSNDYYSFNPLIKVSVAFLVTVLVLVATVVSVTLK